MHQASTCGKWWTAAAILPGQLTIAFGMFGVVVALPNIITAFGTDVQTVQWVMTAYLIARVIPMPAMGWLIGQFGQRNLYVLGVLGTTLTTVLCGLSWSIESLIVFRAMQGLIGALVMSIGMVILYEAFPTEQRGLAMGLFIMVASFGPTLGQSVGGYLVQAISWRAIFFLALPSGLIGTLLPLMRMPRDRPATEKTIDVFAAVQELLLQAGEAWYGIPTQTLAALASLLTEQARLAAYQDCFLLIGITFLLSLLPAWWARTRMPRPPAPHARREPESVQGAAMVPDAAVPTASRV